MPAYYNEIDPYAAEWLRNLIAAGHIAPGDVDERSIADVRADDLKGYVQCHFFAGIGVWSHALRTSGWHDDRPVWTGSCPCQPFSAAGKGEGAADPRHLWPEWFRLVRQCRPVAVFGEQVSAAIRHDWLDLVSADLEGLGYAVGAAVLGAHSVGAPHVRQRLYFVAESGSRRTGRDAGRALGPQAGGGGARSADGLRCGDAPISVSATGELADADGRNPGAEREQRLRDDGGDGRATGELAHPLPAGRAERGSEPRDGSPAGGSGNRSVEHAEGEQVGVPGRARVAGEPRGVALVDANDAGPQGRRCESGERAGQRAVGAAGFVESVGDTADCGRKPRERNSGIRAPDHEPGNASEQQCSESAPSFWSDIEWLPCIDGKTRPTQPGLFPLAHGATARVGRLRAYGNAIVAPLAAEFVRAYLDC